LCDAIGLSFSVTIITLFFLFFPHLNSAVEALEGYEEKCKTLVGLLESIECDGLPSFTCVILALDSVHAMTLGDKYEVQLLVADLSDVYYYYLRPEDLPPVSNKRSGEVLLGPDTKRSRSDNGGAAGLNVVELDSSRHSTSGGNGGRPVVNLMVVKYNSPDNITRISLR